MLSVSADLLVNELIDSDSFNFEGKNIHCPFEHRLWKYLKQSNVLDNRVFFTKRKHF